MKKNQHTYPLFTASGCLSEQAISRLASNLLTTSEKEKASSHLQHCALCREALEGWVMVSEPALALEAVAEINAQVQHTAGLSAASQGFKSRAGSKQPYYYIAAALILLLAGWKIFIDRAVEPLNLNSETAETVPILEKQVPPRPPSPETDQVEPVQTTPSNTLAFTNEPSDPLVTVENNKTTPRAERKTLNELLKISPDLKSQENGLDAYLLEVNEKTIARSGKRRGQPLAIASNQPIDYYLAEVIIADGGKDNGMLPLLPETSSHHSATNSGQAAAEEQTNLATHFFNPVETMPEFQGGYDGLTKYLRKQLRYPTFAKDMKIQGRVIVSFLIDERGAIKNITVLHGIGGGCDEEAIRVIRAMPAWQPARQNGEAVAVQFTLPINFRIL